MLLAIKKRACGSGMDQLRIVRYLWKALASMISKKRAVMDDILDRDKLLSIIDTGTWIMSALTSSNDETVVPYILKSILGAMSNMLIHSKKHLVLSDFEGKDMFQKCFSALKDPSGVWKFNDCVWKKATKFFAVCCTGNLKILSSENDFKGGIIPFCADYITKAPKEALEAYSFQMLLRRASQVIGKKEARRSPNLAVVLSNIIDSENKDVSQKTKDAADDLLVFLCN